MSKHTQGKWYIGGDKKDLWISSDSNEICSMTTGVNGTKQAFVNYKANAHLIASAPELLKALKEIINNPSDMCSVPMGITVRARTAINKAEGKGQ